MEDSPSYDVVLQTATQDLAYRYVSYFNEHRNLNAYPQDDFVEAVEEPGPHTAHTGPCVTVFRRLRQPPDQFLAWLSSTTWMWRNVTRVLVLPSNATVHSSREALIQDIVAQGPPAPDAIIRVNAYPKSLESHLGEHLPGTFQLHHQRHTHVLMATELPVEGGQGGKQLRWGYTPASWLVRPSHEVPKTFEGTASTAVNKIEEALTVFRLKGQGRLRAAIDVGAAPGSWSSYLASNADVVVAVDPAELAPAVLALPNLHHIKLKSQDEGVAAQVSSTLASCGGLADLLVCDMNIHPMQACEVVESMLQYLRPGGHVVMTMKMHGVSRDRSKTFGKLCDFFKGKLISHDWVWLLANTKFEATYCAQKPEAA